MGDVPQIPKTPPSCTNIVVHVFALLISMPCFESINFYQNKLKINLYLQNNTTFLSAGDSAPTPRNAPFPIADFWLRVCYATYAAHTSKF